jgi:hypothetical protein
MQVQMVLVAVMHGDVMFALLDKLSEEQHCTV